MCQASPPPVHNLHLGPAVTEELVVCPGCEEDGVDPEEDPHQAHQQTAGVAVVEVGGLARAVIVPFLSLVVPPPVIQQNINF